MAESVDAACNVQLDLENVCSDRIDARRPRMKLSSFVVFTLALDSEIDFPPPTTGYFPAVRRIGLGAR
jgi:hypothetical protein